MPFRQSAYIDFDSGTVKVAPMDLIGRFGPRAKQPVKLMLLTFECQVDVWLFGPAVEILKLMETEQAEMSVWRHSGYTLLGACFNYFEMIGKILNPKSNDRNSSGIDFNYGFCDVYPTFAVAGDARDDAKLPVVAEFRDRVRNGMYHLGYTKSQLWIHHRPLEFPDDFMVVLHRGNPQYLVNPHHLIRTLLNHFPTVIKRLNDPSAESDQLHRKFKEFYVHFHQARGKKAAP